MRKTLALLLVALVIPSATLAATASAGTSTPGKAKVTYVLRGKLSNYTAASSSGNGSITIYVAHANHHNGLLRRKSFTFVVTANTKVSTSSKTGTKPAQIKNGTRGAVTFRARLKISNGALLAALSSGSTVASSVFARTG
jgi:hypothetical protein